MGSVSDRRRVVAAEFPRSRESRGATLVGGAVAFVAAVTLIRFLRPALLVDLDHAWLLPRLVLQLVLLTATVSAGGVSAAMFLLWSRDRRVLAALQPLSFRRGSLVVLATLAVLLGTMVRFWDLERLPEPLWVDDLSLISPALALRGDWTDFSNSVRRVPYGIRSSHGTVGVLYLELFRISLQNVGTSVSGVRLPSALAGALSLVTASLLGRALLPRGGGALAGLVLAGLRWHLIMSRWAWVAIALVPVLDVATLILIFARRRRSFAAAAVSGLIAGIAAHFYLAAWIAGAALFAFAVWPRDSADKKHRLSLGLTFLVGFLGAATPLVLLHEAQTTAYFSRLQDNNLVLEFRRTKSLMPALAVTADSILAPWFAADPVARHDLPHRSRLGPILGLPIAAILARSLLRPREEISGFLLAHCATAFGASVLWGQAGHPNGFRFAYLTTVTAVAASAGTLFLLSFASRPNGRAGSMIAVGLIALTGVIGGRDALSRWSRDRATFDAFDGKRTLIGRAATRWENYGTVMVDESLTPAEGSQIVIEAIRRYRLEPDGQGTVIGSVPSQGSGRRSPERVFRVVPPNTIPEPAERLVEHVQDGWNRDWAIVLARAGSGP